MKALVATDRLSQYAASAVGASGPGDLPLRPGQDHSSLTALLKDLHSRAAGLTKHAEAAGTTKRRPLHVVIDVRPQWPLTAKTLT